MEVLPHAAARRSARWPGGCARTAAWFCLVADRDLSASGVEVDFFRRDGPDARGTGMPCWRCRPAHTAAAVTLWYDESPGS